MQREGGRREEGGREGGREGRGGGRSDRWFRKENGIKGEGKRGGVGGNHLRKAKVAELERHGMANG